MSEEKDVRQSATGNNIAQASEGSTALVLNIGILNIYKEALPLTVDEGTLKEAQRTLDSIPLETIPNLESHLPLSPTSHIPFIPNPYFVGRDDELKALATSLKLSKVFVVSAVTGIGGIGKSQLAIEFAHRYGSYFAGGVFWLNFADPANILTEIANCRGVSLPSSHVSFIELSLAEQVGIVGSAWKSPLPRLLVFDNCEDPALLEELRPTIGGCRVLATSRQATWSPTLNIRLLPIDTLEPEEGLQLLQNYLPNCEADAELRAIAEELGCLPLALHLAGNFMRRYQHSDFGQPASYLEQLRSDALLSHPSLRGRGSDHSPTGHVLNVAKTFALSFDKLAKTNLIDLIAQELLIRAAYFAPGEPIPRDLLLATFNRLPPRFIAAVFKFLVANSTDSSNFSLHLLCQDALTRLLDVGLLEQESDGNLKLHRLVAGFAHAMNSATRPRRQVERTIYRAAQGLSQKPALLSKWQSHLRYIADEALKRDDKLAAQLSWVLGNHLNDVGSSAEAIPYFDQAINIYERKLGKRHLITAACINDLGLAFKPLGNYEDAKSQLERALNIRKKRFIPKPLLVAGSLNNLGDLLSARGNIEENRNHHEKANRYFKKSLDYHKRALVIRKKWLGLKHHYVASSLNNIGFVYMLQGNYAEAQNNFERVLEIVDAIDFDHYNKAYTLDNLGLTLEAQKDYEGAKFRFEQAWAIRKAALGEDHSLTQITKRSLERVTQLLLSNEVEDEI